MLESIQNDNFEYEKLSSEEQQRRGILGRLKGIIADFKNPTRNGRLYGQKVWESVFNDPITQEKIANRCMFGEMEHPTDGRTSIDPEKIAVCLAEQPKKDNKGHLIGVFDILNTPCGKILKTLLDYGTTVGISSRGQGDTFINNDGVEEVDPSSYDCTGWDIVLIPAVKSARLSTVTESVGNKSLKMALAESIESSKDEDKKVMRETLDKLGINLSESASTDILQAVKEHFGVTEEFYKGPTFILPDGSFLDLRNEKHHSSVERWLIDSGLSTKEFIETAGSPTLYDLGCIRCDYVKYYISLSNIQPTREQYNSLLIWLDELQRTTQIVEVITSDDQHVVYHLDDIISDYVVDRIRRYYSSGTLYEKLNQKHQHNFTYKRMPIGEALSQPQKSSQQGVNIDAMIESDKADNDGESLVEELQTALLEVQTLREKVGNLQEKLSVCYAKEFDYEEEIENHKKTISKLTESNRTINPLKKRVDALTEELDRKQNRIADSDTAIERANKKLENLRSKCNSLTKELSEKTTLAESLQSEINSLKEDFSKNNGGLQEKVDSLKEELIESKKDGEISKKEFARKLEKANLLVEKYRKIAKTSVNKYIDSQAVKLGVNSSEIKAKLGESYTFDDIDKICEDIQDNMYPMNNLPFDLRFKKNSKIKISESVNKGFPSTINEDDIIDNSLLELLGMK